MGVMISSSRPSDLVWRQGIHNKLGNIWVLPVSTYTSFFPWKIFTYLFIWPCWLLVEAYGVFSWSMWTLSCRMRDLIPWPGMEPGPSVLGAQSLGPWTSREVSSICTSCGPVMLFRRSVVKSCRFTQSNQEAIWERSFVGWKISIFVSRSFTYAVDLSFTVAVFAVDSRAGKVGSNTISSIYYPCDLSVGLLIPLSPLWNKNTEACLQGCCED